MYKLYSDKGEYIMKLDIEKWNENSENLSEAGKKLLEESVLCYKNVAYRSSFLMSYLSFMVTIKDRVINRRQCPEWIATEVWKRIVNDLTDDDKWEETVIELLLQAKPVEKIFSCKGKTKVAELIADLEGTSQQSFLNELKKVSKEYEGVDSLEDEQTFYFICDRITKSGKENSETKSRRKANLFNLIGKEFSTQFDYFRRMRNRCAHYKMGEVKFGSCNVEGFWEFMIYFLPRLQIGGTIEYWKEQLMFCYKFYKDDGQLLDETFLSLKTCQFEDKDLEKLWFFLLAETKIQYNFWEDKIIGDLNFFEYIISNSWTKESFINLLIHDIEMKQYVQGSYLELFYKFMREEIRPLIRNKLGVWKGSVYEKLLTGLKSRKGVNLSVFNIWYDLITDLEGNTEKQEELIKVMDLFEIVNIRNKMIDLPDKLKAIKYFTIIKEKTALLLYESVGSGNYNNFTMEWNTSVDNNLWAIDNTIAEMEYKKDEKFVERLKKFFKEINRIPNETPDYYSQYWTSKKIIDALGDNKYNNINELYLSILQK